MTPARSLAVAAPPRVRDWLRAAPDGPVAVVHRGRHALYVDVVGWCVGLVSPGAARVPCALRSAVDVFAGMPANAAISTYVESGTLHVDSRQLMIGRLEATDVPRLDLDVVPSTQADSVTVAATPPAPVAEFAAAQLGQRRVDAAVALDLLGCGEGLTPLGDDLLCGWLALHRAVGVATDEVDAVIDSHRWRTTLLSATLLDCARHGEVLPEFGAWIRALGTPRAAARARALSAVGATSGAGMLYGAQLALDQLREADPRFDPSFPVAERTLA